MLISIPGQNFVCQLSVIESLENTFWNEESFVLPIFCAHTVVPRDGWEDSQSLLDARFQVGHIRDAFVVQPPFMSFKNLVHLLHESVLHIRVLGKVVGEGGESVGGCLEAGEQEDDGLPRDLAGREGWKLTW